MQVTQAFLPDQWLFPKGLYSWFSECSHIQKSDVTQQFFQTSDKSQRVLTVVQKRERERDGFAKCR